MKTLVLSILVAATAVLHAATPTTDTALGVTLLPDTPYRVTATVETNDVTALLALLLGNESPLQILDGNGNLLGQVDIPSLIDSLTGLLGGVTRVVEFTITTAGDTVNNAVERILDSPAVEVRDVVVSAIGPADNRPSIRITQKQKSGMNLRLRGVASDDQQVARVEVIANGKVRRAKGTNNWRFNTKLHEGKNRIVVRAFDNVEHASSPKRVTVRARE